MDEPTDYLKTSDIKTASYLLTMNLGLVGLDRSNPKKAYFIFAKSKLLKKLLADYWNDQACVNPRLLFSSLDRLKDAIHRDYDI